MPHSATAVGCCSHEGNKDASRARPSCAPVISEADMIVGAVDGAATRNTAEVDDRLGPPFAVGG